MNSLYRTACNVTFLKEKLFKEIQLGKKNIEDFSITHNYTIMRSEAAALEDERKAPHPAPPGLTSGVKGGAHLAAI